MSVDITQFPFISHSPRNSVVQFRNKFYIRDSSTRKIRKYYWYNRRKSSRVYLSYEFSGEKISYYHKLHNLTNCEFINEWLVVHYDHNNNIEYYKDSHGNEWVLDWGVPFIFKTLLEDAWGEYCYIMEDLKKFK